MRYSDYPDISQHDPNLRDVVEGLARDMVEDAELLIDPFGDLFYEVVDLAVQETREELKYRRDIMSVDTEILKLIILESYQYLT